MDVNVRFYASLRDIVGTSHYTVNLGGNTVGDVITALITKYGESLKEEILDPEGDIKQHVKLFINGLNLNQIAPLQNVVKEGDILYIFPPIVAG